MPKVTKELHAIFCVNQRKYGVGRTILKAITQVESYWDPRAYRYEPALFQTMKARDPYWADKDPSIVSASYGHMQVLFTTAWALGMKPDNWRTLTHPEFQALAERLCDPAYNISLGAKLMRELLDRVWASQLPQAFEGLSAMDIALARYNGGFFKNPDSDGKLRNQKYVNKVWRAHAELQPKETPCEINAREVDQL